MLRQLEGPTAESPVAQLPAMECASSRPGWLFRARTTSDETVDTVVRLAGAAGKNPVVVKDHPREWGYVANRVYFAMVGEANRVVDEGIATREEVDQLMVDCFRWPTGPFGMTRGAGSGWS